MRPTQAGKGGSVSKRCNRDRSGAEPVAPVIDLGGVEATDGENQPHEPMHSYQTQSTRAHAENTKRGKSDRKVDGQHSEASACRSEAQDGSTRASGHSGTGDGLG